MIYYSFPWAALALIATVAVGYEGVAFAQRAAGEEAMGQRARRAFDVGTSGRTVPAREARPLPTEERLLEQIERTRKAFQADVTERAKSSARASEERRVERLQSVREEVLSEAATTAERGSAVSDAVVAELRKRFADEFGVEVLGVRAIETDGRPAWAVKIMQPGGNSNAAFRVSTLAVDQESGEVLGELPASIATGTDFPERGARREPATDERGLAIRRRTYR